MNWTKLLANKDAQKHVTSQQELESMRALIARDLADAKVADLSTDRRFATAYNAALQAQEFYALVEAWVVTNAPRLRK